MNVVNLATKRFEKLERAQRETNARLGRIEDTLTRAANALDVHSDVLLTIAHRIDGLVAAIARGRTQDLVRFDDHERRIRALERKRRTRRSRS
jgi:hypothetical protein